MSDLRQKVLNSFERLEIVASNKSKFDLLEAIEIERAILLGIIDKPQAEGFREFKDRDGCSHSIKDPFNVLRN